MTDEKKYEHAQMIMGRLDHYFDMSNNKCSFYIGLNTFILGGICAGYLALYQHVNGTATIIILAILHLVSCLTSTLYTIFALLPFTRHHYTNDNSNSLIFYGSISKHTHAYYKQKFDALTERDKLDDMIAQVHCLSVGLTDKFMKLKIAARIWVIQFVFLLPLFYLIIKNFKP
jgi:hypothetical protein